MMIKLLVALALCTSVATAAKVEIPKAEGSVAGVTTYVGKVVLDNANAYSALAPFGLSFGTGTSSFGFSGEVSAVSNKNPACSGLKNITLKTDFKIVLPSTITTALSTLGGIVSLPAITDLTDGVSVTTTVDVGTADISVKLSDKLTADQKIALKFLGTDITFTIKLTDLKVFKDGVELPVQFEVYVMKKAAMELPTAICGDKGKFPCGTQSCSVGTTYLACQGCGAYCTAVGTAIDTVLSGSDNKAVFEATYSVPDLLEKAATAASATLPANVVRTCGNQKCFGIGGTSSCTASASSSKSAAGTMRTSLLSLVLLAMAAFLKM